MSVEIFKVSKVGKVAGSKVIEGEISNDSNVSFLNSSSWDFISFLKSYLIMPKTRMQVALLVQL